MATPIKTWNVDDAHGNAIAAGWRGTLEDARVMAQGIANRLREKVALYWSTDSAEDSEIISPSADNIK